jgi:hypothetical protein
LLLYSSHLALGVFQLAGNLLGFISPSDMPGVPRELVEHALNVDPQAKPVKQPLRRFDKPKRKAIASKLHRLENAGFI